MADQDLPGGGTHDAREVELRSRITRALVKGMEEGLTYAQTATAPSSLIAAGPAAAAAAADAAGSSTLQLHSSCIYSTKVRVRARARACVCLCVRTDVDVISARPPKRPPVQTCFERMMPPSRAGVHHHPVGGEGNGAMQWVVGTRLVSVCMNASLPMTRRGGPALKLLTSRIKLNSPDHSLNTRTHTHAHTHTRTQLCKPLSDCRCADGSHGDSDCYRPRKHQSRPRVDPPPASELPHCWRRRRRRRRRR